jgi:hypothetical protein
MRLGLVITVKNEERLLALNLKYHKALGIERAFVYLDGSTDGTAKSVADLSFVEIEQSVSKQKYAHVEAQHKFIETYDTHHTARQCLNTYDAKMKCRALGIDWLFSIDADELIVINKKTFQRNALTEFCKDIDGNVDEVNLQTLEAVGRKLKYDNVFGEETLYKAKWNFQTRLDLLRKKVFDPFSQNYRKQNIWYGQNQGKSGFRVTSNVIPRTVHRYTTETGEIHNRIAAGYLCHYHAYDFLDFIKKFQNMSNHPDTHIAGRRVESIKLLWRDVVNRSELNQNQLMEYYKKNVMFSDSEILSYRLRSRMCFWIKEKPLIEIFSPKDYFEKYSTSSD